VEHQRGDVEYANNRAQLIFFISHPSSLIPLNVPRRTLSKLRIFTIIPSSNKLLLFVSGNLNYDPHVRQVDRNPLANPMRLRTGTLKARNGPRNGPPEKRCRGTGRASAFHQCVWIQSTRPSLRTNRLALMRERGTVLPDLPSPESGTRAE